MSSIKNGTTIKIGVRFPQRSAELLEVDLSSPLSGIVEDLCRREGITNATGYALAFTDRKTGYIVEERKQDVKNGDILELTTSPAKKRQEILEKLNFGGMDEKVRALSMLHERASDPVFASEFINSNGHSLLMSTTETGLYKGKTLGKVLQCFEKLMEHNIVSWDAVTDKFVTRLLRQVTSSSNIDNVTVEVVLSILESAVSHRPDLYHVVATGLPFPKYVNFMGKGSIAVLKNALALLNTLFMKADYTEQLVFESKILKFGLKSVVYHRLSSMAQVDIELAHQLFVMQSLLLNMYEEKRNSVFDLKDQSNEQKIKMLLKHGFGIDSDDAETAGSRSCHRFYAELKLLGIKYVAAPIKDFMKPYGRLALDSLAYFAENHSGSFSRLVQENTCSSKEHSFSIATGSIKLSELLCKLFHIGEPIEEQGVYYPMFFSHRCFFEELFTIGMMLVFKTWCEMKATTEDIDKVFSIVREQIARTLKSDPNSPTIQDFRRALWKVPYSVVVGQLQKERAEREEWESQSAAVRELRHSVLPSVMELVKENRLNFLCKGTMFQRYTSKGQRLKDKYWYVMLSPNHKYLHYGDCSTDHEPKLEELPHKLAVTDIATLQTAAECPHARKLGSKAVTHLAFSVVPRYEEVPLNFVAPNEEALSYWMDGLNALIGNPMTSEESKRDMEMLLHMEIKLRLLETEGMSIPDGAPPIPPDPDDFNFHF